MLLFHENELITENYINYTSIISETGQSEIHMHKCNTSTTKLIFVAFNKPEKKSIQWWCNSLKLIEKQARKRKPKWIRASFPME